MKQQIARINDMRRRAHSYLKWFLSALSAALTTSFVVILEAQV
jgi:hypothetical protein